MIYFCDFIVLRYMFVAHTHIIQLRLGVKFFCSAIWSCIFASNRAVDLCLPRQGNLGRTTLIDIRDLFWIKWIWITHFLHLAAFDNLQINQLDILNMVFVWGLSATCCGCLSDYAPNMDTVNQGYSCLCLLWLLTRMHTKCACELNLLDWQKNWDVSQNVLVKTGGNRQNQESPRQTKPKKGPKRNIHEFHPFLWILVFLLRKQARFTLSFCSRMPLWKVHELTFL